LINALNPVLETIEETQDLDITQQGEAFINETLQGVTSAPPVLTPTGETPTVTAATIAVTEGLVPAQPTLGVPQPTPAATETGTAALTVASPATAAATPTPATPVVAATTAATTAAVAENVNPAAQAIPTVDPTRFGVAVYEIRNQAPAPSEPKPIRPDIFPPVPIGRVRPVDRLVLRREWERRREGGIAENVRQSTPLAEKSIQQMVTHANADLVANGLPLRLVLSKKDNRYLLDIYDCSDDEACRLEQEIPLDLSKLSTILDNIEHESGIIVNLMT
jgi:hypothetical protein